jgi:hypothetical protein
MVMGLVEPYDGFDLMRIDPKNPPPAPWTIQPTNPELLQALAEDFRDHNYSVQRVIKTIMKSNAYQLSTAFPGEWKDSYVPYHARRFARVLSGPEAVDIMAEATAAPFDFRQYGQARSYVHQLTNPTAVEGGGGGGGTTRAGDSPENQAIASFMMSYYQVERSGPPQDKRIANPVQAMMMMSSPIVTKRVRAEGSNRVANLLKAGKSDEEIIEELFLSSLSRRPTPEEMQVGKRVLAQDRKTGAEDTEWALLNTTEFMVNH